MRAIAIIIKTMNLKQKATDRQTERKRKMFRGHVSCSPHCL